MLGGFLLLGVFLQKGLTAEAPRITKEELKPMLGRPDVVIVDVRSGPDWENSKSKIQGAIREDPGKDIQSWGQKYSKDKTLIFYCS